MSNGRRTTLAKERASAQIESPHLGTHYFLVPLVQIFARDRGFAQSSAKLKRRYRQSASVQKWIAIIMYACSVDLNRVRLTIFSLRHDFPLALS